MGNNVCYVITSELRSSDVKCAVINIIEYGQCMVKCFCLFNLIQSVLKSTEFGLDTRLVKCLKIMEIISFSKSLGLGPIYFIIIM